MKPAPFDYTRPRSIEEAVAALGEHGDEAKVLAGGQSLVPLMNLRLAQPELLVDINRIHDLASIEDTGHGLRIGAVARQADVETSPVAAGLCPLVVEALHHVAHPQLRNRGTVVGSLAHHDPLAELPTVAVALDAVLTLAGPREARTVDATEFFTSHFTTVAEPDELITHVLFPSAPAGTQVGFSEFARRRGDFAIVAAAATLLIKDETVTGASVAVAGAADHPIRCWSLEAQLTGQPATAQTWTEAGAAAASEDGISPADDLHASAAYRRSIIPIVVKDALTRAFARVS